MSIQNTQEDALEVLLIQSCLHIY